MGSLGRPEAVSGVPGGGGRGGCITARGRMGTTSFDRNHYSPQYERDAYVFYQSVVRRRVRPTTPIERWPLLRAMEAKRLIGPVSSVTVRDRGVAWYPRRMGCVGLEFESRRSHRTFFSRPLSERSATERVGREKNLFDETEFRRSRESFALARHQKEVAPTTAQGSLLSYRKEKCGGHCRLGSPTSGYLLFDPIDKNTR